MTTATSPVGYWRCVDDVEKVEDFVPGQKQWDGDLFLKELGCFENGRTTTYNNWIWKNGLIIGKEIINNDKEVTASAQYYIKTINDSTYLFFPWLIPLMMSNDKFPYFVFKKISDQPYSPISLSDLPKIDRHPSVYDFGRAKLDSIPTFNPQSREPFQVDLINYDLSELDLRGSFENLLYANFDNKTVWPPDIRMPKGFNRNLIMELGKDPGLGVRNLHLKGITGRNVGIAIIDQPLLIDHQEYKDRLRLYEETEDISGIPSPMHGPAVASISVGKTVGVAPEADLYFIATSFGTGQDTDFFFLARCIRRILQVNKILPNDSKIRVISISRGWGPKDMGYQDIKAATEEAKAAGMFIVCSSIEEVYGFKFHGLGRPPMSDPNTFESYEPGLWWVESYYSGEQFNDRLLVPMDSRTTASPTGNSDYTFYREGGWSWSIPYIAGVYALAAQIDPKITPEKFWATAMKTGKTIELKHDGKVINFGPIINPVALIDELKKK